MQTRNGKATAQAQNANFALHTLGWEAFQNLCGHIAREILGQTVTCYSPSGDAGQDGAFQGLWQRANKEVFQGRFVLQCKFTTGVGGHLGLGNLTDELTKAKRLAELGKAQTYLLITNAKISGESDLKIRHAFERIPGIQHFDILGEEWITQSILASKSLRAFVPRVYGLGDLSQILDERAYRQASEILSSWRDNLTKFVPTDAHERSVRALVEKGFVLLLGDPMAGKSTIAAALALAASDRWNCLPVFVRHPDDLRHWNPDEPNQFFWVDDAFGQIQVEPDLTAAWNRALPYLATAIRKGARILFTSRTYIYNAAISQIKVSGFPLLCDSQVTINVERLSLIEKERILYNHLRLGAQPKAFRAAIKEHLGAIAANVKFFPEVAKRLGDPFFTGRLELSPASLRKFVEEPIEVLYEIISQLDRANFSALALLFMRGGRINIPPTLDPSEREAIELLGASLSGLCDGLRALEGSLVSQAVELGEKSWKFRHPTVRDAMALHVAARPELLDIYLGGVKLHELLSEVVCGNLAVAGAKVHVPASRFSIVISLISSADLNHWNTQYNLLGFLSHKCADSFLQEWANAVPGQMEALFNFFSVSSTSFCYLLSRLQRVSGLSESLRLRYVEDVEESLLSSAESNFLSEDLQNLVTPDELAQLVAKTKAQVIPKLELIIGDVRDSYDDPDQDPTDYFDDLSSNLDTLLEYFSDDEEVSDALSGAIESIGYAISELEKQNRQREQEMEDQKEEERLEAEERQRMEEEERRHIEAALGQTMRSEREREAVQRSVSLPRAPQFESPPRNIFDDVDS